MLNIDDLKRDAIMHPYYHGLGCIRVKTSKEITYSFYSKEHTPAESMYVHTHQTEIHSTMLAGRYKNIVYDYTISDEPTNWCLQEIQCQGGTEPVLLHENVNLIQKESTIIDKEFTHGHNIFHDLELLDDIVVTKCFFNYNKSSKTAKVIRNKSIDYVCGLSNMGNPKENWELIEMMINVSMDRSKV